MQKYNLKIINSCFFFFSLTLSVFFAFISALAFDIDLYSAFSTPFILSVIADVLCFYRFNNGLIALIRGRFSKPSRKNFRFVDYDEIPVKNINVIKSISQYGEKSIIVYKLNTREYYQIIKLDDRFLIHRCYPENTDSKIITDFDNIREKYVNSKDTEIIYSAVKSVNYRITGANYFLPVFYINTKNKKYSFIGCFDRLNDDEIKRFFDDKVTVKIKEKTNKSVQLENAALKNTFYYNLLTLAACTVVPQSIFVSFYDDSGIKHIVSSFYIAVSLAVLLAYALLPIFSEKNLR